MEWILEIGAWLLIVSGFFAGVALGDGFFLSLFAGIFSAIVSAIFGSVIFGGFIILNETRKSVANIEEMLSQQSDS
jgi:hypothetical protein